MRCIQLPMETLSTQTTDVPLFARLLDYTSLEVGHETVCLSHFRMMSQVLHGANLQLHDEPRIFERQQSKEQDWAATAAHATSQINVPRDDIKMNARNDAQDVLKVVCEVAHEIIGAEIETNAPLMSAGLDSLSAVEFTNALGARFGIELVPTTLYDHPTLESLARFLASELGNEKTEASQEE